MAMLNNQMVIPRRTILCSHLALRDFDPVNRDHPGDQIPGALGKGLPKKCSATEWGRHGPRPLHKPHSTRERWDDQQNREIPIPR